MTAVDDATLFIIGVVVSIPTIIVVVALVFAAGVDERQLVREQLDLKSAP
jgi:hypothetical protein